MIAILTNDRCGGSKGSHCVNTYSEYSISYANSTIRYIVEGTNWGTNVRVALGSLSYNFEDNDLATIDCQDAWDSFVKFDMPQNEHVMV
jgi:hypothetical protein